MTDLRKRGAMSWGALVMQFVGQELPQLLGEFGEGKEAEALEALAKKYREHRTAQMSDRRPEIEAGRAAVDERIEERKKAKKADPSG